MKILLLVLLLATCAFGQSFDPQTAARAGVHDLSQRGPNVLNWNPALLGPEATTHNTLELPSFVAAANNNSFSVRYWNQRFGKGGFLDNAAKDDILDHIPGGGLAGHFQMSAPVVGYSYNRAAGRLAVESINATTLPRDLAVLALKGNDLNRLYSIGDFNAESMTMLDAGAGFSYQFEQEDIADFYVGAAFHYYQGLYLAKTEEVGGNMVITQDSLRGWSVIHTITSHRGDGVGFDLGALAMLTGKLQVGLSVRQISTRLSWDVHRNDYVSFYTDSLGVRIDSLDREGYFKRALHYRDTSYAGGAVDTRLPTIMEATVRYQWQRNVAFMGDILYRGSTTASGVSGLEAGIAAEYAPKSWLVLQSGLSAGGPWAWRVGLGGGLRFAHYEMDLGWSWNNGLFNGAHGVGFGLSQRVKF